jgi:hypothetical protein
MLDSRLRGNDVFSNAVSDSVIPANAGIQVAFTRMSRTVILDSRLRGNDVFSNAVSDSVIPANAGIQSFFTLAVTNVFEQQKATT